MIIQLYSFSFIHYHGIGLIGLIGWIGVDSLNRWIGVFALLWINECHFKTNWITKSAIKSPCFGTWKGQWKATGSGRRGGNKKRERKKNEIKERKKKVEALIKKLKCRSRCQSLKWTAQVGIWKLQTLRPTFSTSVQATSTTLNFALIRHPFSHPPTHPHTHKHEDDSNWFHIGIFILQRNWRATRKMVPVDSVEPVLKFIEMKSASNDWNWVGVLIEWKPFPVWNSTDSQWMKVTLKIKSNSKRDWNAMETRFKNQSESASN